MDMYQKLPNLVLGFHGCNQVTYDEVISGGQQLKASENAYDWLGNGIYFWEQNYQRAYDWAKDHFKNHAAVIGAVIDLGYCLNLTDSVSADILRMGYSILKVRCDSLGNDLPQNRNTAKTKDFPMRDLDCAVIQQIHDYNKENDLRDFDSVRGIFTEGNEVYKGSAFQERTHIQLCICNPNCIKGYFKPISQNSEYDMP